MDNSLAISYKTKHVLTVRLNNCPLGLYSREMKTSVHTRTFTWMFTVALFMVAPRWQQLKRPSMNGWIVKHMYMHTVEHLPEGKREKPIDTCNILDGSQGNYAESNNQSLKLTQRMIPFRHRYWYNNIIQNRWVVARGNREGLEGG